MKFLIFLSCITFSLSASIQEYLRPLTPLVPLVVGKVSEEALRQLFFHCYTKTTSREEDETGPLKKKIEAQTVYKKIFGFEDLTFQKRDCLTDIVKVGVKSFVSVENLLYWALKSKGVYLTMSAADLVTGLTSRILIYYLRNTDTDTSTVLKLISNFVYPRLPLSNIKEKKEIAPYSVLVSLQYGIKLLVARFLGKIRYSI
jgi:hypothetical protein